MFVNYLLEVAYMMIADYKLKIDIMAESILHDTVEDTQITGGMLLDSFVWKITQMVGRLKRDRADGFKISVERILDNAYKE